MTKIHVFSVAAGALFSLFQPNVAAEPLERSAVPVSQTWRLEDIYATDYEWSQAKDKLALRFDGILSYRGKLGQSAAELLACLEYDSGISKELARLANYAEMKSDQNSRDSKYLAMNQQAQQLGTEYGTKASFIRPQIASIDAAAIERFIAEEPGLKIYSMFLHDIQRLKTHTLSENEEKILAQAGTLAEGPYSIYKIFSDAELPYPAIKLGDGSSALLTKAGFDLYRTLPNRSDREAVFREFWATLEKFKGTFGTQMYSQLNKDIFFARARKYNSSLESALDNNNIPTEVYLTLIKNVHENMDSFHRYLKLKKRMLGVEQLKFSDMYAPVVKEVDLKYTFDQAKKIVLEAVEPLGEDYVQVARQCFENRWIDVHPTPGKRSGAYSNGSIYDVHPYILLNFNGKYDDVSTLAHELGHTMHSYYSNKNQPYPTADYSIFVAEVASTFNEALLIDRMLKDIKDDDVRLSLLMNYLDGLKGTLFRQTQFAEFELRIHEKAEQGEPLTGDILSKMYQDLAREYYGHDKGICYIDDSVAIEWAFVPHFYYNFYVYQYSTSFTASTALAEKVLDGDKNAAEKYLQFLSSGGSAYPIELLKKTGVDMTTAEPFKKAIAAMNRTMDEIEKILQKQTR
ncbi:MAG: oligoendopeptidase F [Planctomycetota bacterium]|nr:oligoendopeptidase F [Planctomycetota bacterium]